MDPRPLLGIVLLAHGSRDARWRLPVEAIASRIATRAPDVAVRCAYIELTTPDLNTAAAELVAVGVRSLHILPIFFGVGLHLREDLPRLVQGVRAAHPGLTVTLADAAGEHPEVVELLADIALRDARK